MAGCWEQLEVKRLLKEHGAVLERKKKHRVYRFPSGRIWVTPSTPSGAFNWKNTLAELRVSLGLVGERGAEGVRRPKKAFKKMRAAQAMSIIPTASVILDLRAQIGELSFTRKCFECGWKIKSKNPDRVQLCALCRVFLEIYIVNGRPKVGALWKYVAPLHQSPLLNPVRPKQEMTSGVL